MLEGVAFSYFLFRYGEILHIHIGDNKMWGTVTFATEEEANFCVKEHEKVWRQYADTPNSAPSKNLLVQVSPQNPKEYRKNY